MCSHKSLSKDFAPILGSLLLTVSTQSQTKLQWLVSFLQ